MRDVTYMFAGMQDVTHNGQPIGKVRWSSWHAVLGASNFYGAHIKDSDGLTNLLGTLVKMDRLPTTNSLEGLRLLREVLY